MPCLLPLLLLALLLQLLLSATAAHAAPVRTCASVTVPPCLVRANRDVLFLLDTSNSMDRGLFYTLQLDFVQSVLCAFDSQDVTRTGLITFSSNVVLRIPLKKYTVDKWFALVETLRSDPKTCCSQGTPTAEALKRAREVFTSNPSSNDRVTFVMTDGSPYQVTASKAFPGSYSFPTYSMATYQLQIVPTQANMLKQISRLVVVGLPEKDGSNPDERYFKGIPEPARNVCGGASPNEQGFRYTANAPLQCGVMSSPPFPIVTTPLRDNWFNATLAVDLESVLQKLVPALCSVTPEPTTDPTRHPTKTPTLLPTQPTRIPSQSPTPNTTLAPSTLAPTNPTLQPTLLPTMDPTTRPTSMPSPSPTTHVPTLEPTTGEPTQDPTPPPTRSPTRRPTFTPTLNPTTRGPSKLPTKAPSRTPTHVPSWKPTSRPTTKQPTLKPTRIPAPRPTNKPTRFPSNRPTGRPTKQPTRKPTRIPTPRPTNKPTRFPSNRPTGRPTKQPTRKPTKRPTQMPSHTPTLVPTQAAWVQQGNKLVPADGVKTPNHGSSLALSSDGNTALVGGPWDNNAKGAAWVYVRSPTASWSQQGGKLTDPAASIMAFQGIAVALSADGDTAVIGGPYQTPSGASWVWSRNGAGVWSQVGGKLIGTGAQGPSQLQGNGVAISGNGLTLLSGGPADNDQKGATWVFVFKSGQGWKQQGPKLVGRSSSTTGRQGYGVALSHDGNTALIGGFADDENIGAVWVFVRNAGVWSQQGPKLRGSNAFVRQGFSVDLSSDGNTAAFGTKGNVAMVVFVRSGTTWSRQQIVMDHVESTNDHRVSLSNDGNTAVIGVWIGRRFFTLKRVGSVWSPLGGLLWGTGGTPGTQHGDLVAMAGDGQTLIESGWNDNGEIGAVWVFVRV